MKEILNSNFFHQGSFKKYIAAILKKFILLLEKRQRLPPQSHCLEYMSSTFKMPPEDAQKFLATLDSHRKLIEHSDLVRKLDELEEIYKTK